MGLASLIYVSKASPSFTSSDIDALLNSARKNNQQLGLTGILCFDYQFFIQYLEGNQAPSIKSLKR